MVDAQLIHLDANSSYLEDLARLHAVCLAETITSARGVPTLLRLYRAVCERGGWVIASIYQDVLIGGIAVMPAERELPYLANVFFRPRSWLVAAQKLGPFRFLDQVIDGIGILNCYVRVGPCDRILSLFVSEEHRSNGIGHRLINEVISRAALRQVAIAVDTYTENLTAQNFYIASGFKVFGTTKRSTIFTLVAD